MNPTGEPKQFYDPELDMVVVVTRNTHVHFPLGQHGCDADAERLLPTYVPPHPEAPYTRIGPCYADYYEHITRLRDESIALDESIKSMIEDQRKDVLAFANDILGLKSTVSEFSPDGEENPLEGLLNRFTDLVLVSSRTINTIDNLRKFVLKSNAELHRFKHNKGI